MNPFISALLYVFSGTGNTHRVACWVKERFETNGIPAQIHPIEHARPQTDIQEAHRPLITLLFPTHGFMPPWSMIKFLWGMPRHRDTAAMPIATRGAIRMGPIHIPGAAGFATFMAVLILFFKGYDIRGFFSLDMAANMNNLHPSLSSRAVTDISQRAQEKTHSFLAPVLSGKRLIFTANNLYEGLWTLLLFWFIPLFPLLYLLFAKTSMAKIMFANNGCNACGLCAKTCPNQAIEMKSFWGKTRPFWSHRCENCMRCMAYCRQKAVEAGHSWALVLIFLSTALTGRIIPWLTSATGLFPGMENAWFLPLVKAAYFLPALFFSYWLFWALLRIPAVTTLFSLTTFTHYFNRFHEPDTGLKDLTPKR